METVGSLYDVAIVGMAGRFPGADDLDQFWANLCGGIESITYFSDKELLEAGVAPDLLSDPNYVKANAIASEIDCFDARFFGLSPREAEIMDPQQRVFLEYAWRALENAGYAPGQSKECIGVYAGTSLNTYFLSSLISNQARIGAGDGYQLAISNDRDFLATQVSYRLNLHGPSFTVQTACSTSLVAVHLAYQALLNRECDIALAGGVSLRVPQVTGYLYQEGGITSPDGHCRPFDARAQGTVSGNGVGIVVLERLADALEAGDTIHAIIKGSAVNNDGARKVGYTAPSEDGQVEVITEALAVADVDPATVTYVEAHGTGTVLGDPIEMAALTRAFRACAEAKGFCALGAVKSNIGHLDAAAGVAGLIKTVLALKQKQLPPSFYFSEPNPGIDFENSPFYVNTTLQDWETDGHPRRAGVSSFGMGGTNAHVVLEEASAQEAGGDSRPWHLLPLSAKTRSALEQATDNLAAFLKVHPELDLADVSYTLQVGRRAFEYRQVVACRDGADAVAALETRDPKRVFTGYQEDGAREVTFMFPGLGDQYPNMARGLYKTEPVFRVQVDRCCELLRPHLGLDLREVLFPDDGLEDSSAAVAPAKDFRQMLGRGGAEPSDAATQRLNRTSVAHPAVFVIEYALAQLLMEWGVRPRAVIGHSIGEYVAACLAGVLSLADALALVARRAGMIEALPGGAMLGVSLSEQEVQPLLGEDLSLSAVNGPQVCVLAGPEAAIAELERSLLAQDVACRRVPSSHAFHSHMLDPIVAPLTELVGTFDLKPPQIPYVSNLTGTWITNEQATDAGYWGRHSRHPVRFADGIGELWQDPDGILLEVGPGHTLSTMALQHPAGGEALERVLSTVRHAYEPQADLEVLLNALGKLWMLGVPVDWEAFHGGARRLRVPLPTYPFERERYWIEPGQGSAARADLLARRADMTDWFYVPSWKRTMPPVQRAFGENVRWLVLDGQNSLSEKLVQALQKLGREVIVARAGEQFASDGDTYVVRPAQRDDYDALLNALREHHQMPTHIVHLWNVGPEGEGKAGSIDRALERSFYSVLFLVQALGAQGLGEGMQLTILSSNAHKVESGDAVHPEKAVLVGPCLVTRKETPMVTCNIDVVLPDSGSQQEAWLVGQIIAELQVEAAAPIVAYRGRDRLVQEYEPVLLAEPVKGEAGRLRDGGVYLITGGLGGIGLTLARYLAEQVQARLVLAGRSGLPAREAWGEWLSEHAEEDSTSRKIRAVQELEAAGAEVLTVQADVANETQMRSALDLVFEHFGALHGVIHAAGVPGGGVIQLKTEEAGDSVLKPKVHGTRVLESVIKNVSLDFLVLCSSVEATMGNVGQVDYCAANAFLDAFAYASSRDEGRVTVSVNWDAWAEVGMAVETALNYTSTGSNQALVDSGAEPSQRDLSNAILPGEGVQVFERILSHNTLPQVAVCTRHLPTLVQHARQITYAQLLEGAARAQVAIKIHPRPALASDYIEPRNEIEATIAAVWGDLLGIEKVGIHDNFFGLGGHSLLAIQVVSRVRDAFGVELSMRCLFESPTIADLALAISQEQLGDIIDRDEQTVEALLSEVESLSDDELHRLLAEHLIDREREP